MQTARVQDRDNARPIIGTLFRIWARIGLQSFGGGASTLLLIRREFVETRPWVNADEFGRFWNLCQLTPGINLVALTILIGRKMGGPWGIVVSLAGLLLPSATVTCLLATGFAAVQHSQAVHAILRGVVPATAGIMGVVAYNFARPLFGQARKKGARSLSLSSAMILVSALALIVLKLSVIAVLVGAALLGALLFTPRRTSTPVHALLTHAPKDRPS